MDVGKSATDSSLPLGMTADRAAGNREQQIPRCTRNDRGSATTKQEQRRCYFWLLTTLLFLFILRVVGQILVAFFGVKFLPPMQEWMSGVLPYPGLLTSQILIVTLYGKTCLDFARGYGYFVQPRRRWGINLLKFGWLYLGVMIIRYVIRMGLYPHERWAGGSIPIFFHWVLASFLLVLGHYHHRQQAIGNRPQEKQQQKLEPQGQQATGNRPQEKQQQNLEPQRTQRNSNPREQQKESEVRSKKIGRKQIPLPPVIPKHKPVASIEGNGRDRNDKKAAAKPRVLRARLLLFTQITVAGLGVAFWVLYQLAPSLIAYSMGLRRAQFAVRVQEHVVMTTTDGIQLSSQIFHPQHTERTPTILVRIPLSRTLKNSLYISLAGRIWAERGYTVVIQGTRGRYGSGGEFHPLHGERQDGIETLAWIAKQPWYNGQIGTWGGSAFGYTEWAISDQQSPGPSTLAIYCASSDFHRMFYPGGAFSLYSALSWAGRSYGREDLTDFPPANDIDRAADGFPMVDSDRRLVGQDVQFFREWAQHPERDSFWSDIDGTNRNATLKAPVLLMAGWYDPFLPSQLDDFLQIRRSANSAVAEQSRLIIGPWTHAGEVLFPNGVRAKNFRLQNLVASLRWFDEILQPSRAQNKDASPVRIFVMGKNEWRSEQEWPLSRAHATPLYLRSSGAANSAAGDGRLELAKPMADEPPDFFLYDPKHPVPTAGGAMIGGAAGIARQNEIESRNDVLVYTTAELQNDVEVTGPISLVLYVSTSASHTDFTAKLVDVHPDGSAYNVSEGILRLSSSEARSTEIKEIHIELWPTSMVFFKGHRIRLEVASSNFPRFDRNPNTPENISAETNPVSASQMVYHGARFPSRLILPLVPGS